MSPNMRQSVKSVNRHLLLNDWPNVATVDSNQQQQQHNTTKLAVLNQEGNARRRHGSHQATRAPRKDQSPSKSSSSSSLKSSSSSLAKPSKRMLLLPRVMLSCLTVLLATAIIAIITTTTTHHQNHLYVNAFPSGAPDSACKDLKPGHGVEATSGSSPFELTQDKLQVEAGDQIKVTLSSPSKTNFKGLIVQALDEKGEPRGKFLAGKGLKLLNSCSAVTHSDKEAKKTATLVWEAPSDLKSGKEAFTFKATVVAKFDEFYMNIKSTLATR